MPQPLHSRSDRRRRERLRISRRRLLTAAGASAAGPYVVSAAALGGPGKVGANERITIGAIGVGGRGSGHVNTFAHNPQAQVLAVCDPFGSKREANRKRVEARYAGRAGKGSYKGCAAYADFRDLVARDDIDAVVIASPEYWHALHALWALRSGKDVYCEKAMTLTVAEGRALCRTVRRRGRIFQLGTQQRSGRNFRFACELARNGYLGALRTVEVGVPGGRSLANVAPSPVPPGLDYEMWLGPAPFSPYNEIKCSYNWYFIYDYCIGWIGSWGVHHIDIAQWGAPSLARGRVQVEGSAVFPADGLANTSLTWRVRMTTADGLRLSFADNRRHKQGCRFEGEQGWVHVNRGGIQAEPASLLKVALKPGDERLYPSRNHHGNFLECIRTRRDPCAPVEVGHKATTITIIADIATRVGRKLTWDWNAQRFAGEADDANRFLRRPMRSPWTF